MHGHLQSLSDQCKFGDSAQLGELCKIWNWPMSGSHPGQLSFLFWAVSDTSPNAVNYQTSIKFSAHLIQQHLPEVTNLSLVPPQSTINSRRHSFFVNTAFLWNTVPLHILKDNNRNSFWHHLYA